MHSVIRLLAGTGCLLVPLAARAATDALKVADVDRYITAWSEIKRFSGNVLLAKDGKVLLRKSYGMADRERNVPNRAGTVFRIGSTTKAFTALAVLQLEERGALRLEDPLRTHLPEAPAAWSRVALHHLLTHTSGVPDISKAAPYHEYGDPLRIEKALASLPDLSLQFEPGSRFAYSNSGYMLLGRVIEKISGRKYGEYIAGNILKRAGMKNTALDRTEAGLKHRAAGYVVREGKLVSAVSDNMMGPFSAGGLRSTTDDLLRFDRALYTEGLVKKTTLARAFTPHAKAVFPPPFNDPNAFYGYGWLVSRVAGHKSVSHGGWVNGFVCDFVRYPDDGVVLILLGNIEGPFMPVITKRANEILWGAPYQLPKPRKAVKLVAHAVEPLAGRYEIAPGVAFRISVEADGRMFIEQEGQPVKLEVGAESETLFFVVDLPTMMQFERDAAGKVTAALLDMDGQKLRARRVN